MDRRKCPYCGEEIMISAQKCRFCGEWISNPDSEATQMAPAQSGGHSHQQQQPYGGAAQNTYNNPSQQGPSYQHPYQNPYQPARQTSESSSFFETYFFEPFKTQYADFSGYTNVKSFWLTYLAFWLVNIGIAGLVLMVMAVGGFAGILVGGILGGLFNLAIIIPILALMARRLRDSGKSPWLILISLIPVIGSIILLILLCMPSQYSHPKRNVGFKIGDVLITIACLGMLGAGIVMLVSSITGSLFGNRSESNVYGMAEEIVEETPSYNYNSGRISVYDMRNSKPTYLQERYLTYGDISHLSSSELRILRNAIYAMHDRKFKSTDLQDFFGNCYWYTPIYSEVSQYEMNNYEKGNIEFIQQYE